MGVLFEAPLLTYKESSKVARDIESLVNLNIGHKFFVVIVRKRYHPVRKLLETFNNEPGDQIECLVSNLDYDPEAVLTLDQNVAKASL